MSKKVQDKSHAIAVANHHSTITKSKSLDYYIHAATSDNTRLAYQADINEFLATGKSLPTMIDELVQYLRKRGSPTP